MNPLEALFQYFSDPLIREGKAQQELERQGSVMAKKPYRPGLLGIPGDVVTGLLDQLNPINWMGGMSGSLAAGGMAKVFKPAATKALPYVDKLLAALKSYTNPMELARTKGRLQPALQVAEGAPGLTNKLNDPRFITSNLLVGKPQTWHTDLYDLIQQVPYKDIKHGYFDPKQGIFLDDILNQLLFDPGKLKTSVSLLEKKIPLDAVIEALGFTPKMFP